MRLKRIVLTLVVAGLILALAPACNTLRGVGKDVQRAGEKIQEWSR